MTIRLAVPTAALLLSAFAIPASAAAPEDQARAKTDGIVVSGQADPKQRKICHNEIATGSVMPKRICRTQAEADMAHQQSTRDLDRERDRILAGQAIAGQR